MGTSTKERELTCCRTCGVKLEPGSGEAHDRLVAALADGHRDHDMVEQAE